MNETILQTIKENLLAEKSHLLNRAHDFKVTELLQKESASDESDRTSQELLMNSTIQIHEKDRFKILQIEKAISKIESGTFAQCEDCGDDISLARLKALPFTTLCICCQEDREDSRHLFN